MKMKERPEVLCLKLKSEKWKTNGKNKKNKKKNWLEILLEQKHGQTGLFYCENGKKKQQKDRKFPKIPCCTEKQDRETRPSGGPARQRNRGRAPMPTGIFSLSCSDRIVPYRIASYRRPAQSRGGVVARICLSHACRSDKLRYLTLRQRGRIEWSG